MKEKRSDLQRMFEVLRAIEHEDLNNSEYSLVTVSDDEILDTAHYFKTVDVKILSSGLYICIWIDVDDRGNFPEPDFEMETEITDEYIMFYRFENK